MKILFLFFTLISFAKASIPTLDQLSQSDADNISKEFSSNFVHTAVSGAGTLGKVFGLEAGLVYGFTNTPSIETISKRYSSSSNVANIPTASLLGIVSVPFGFTFEGNYIPKIAMSGVSFKNYSVATKFTLTHFMPNTSFDLSAKVFMGAGDLSYSSVINNSSTGNQNVSTKVNYDNSTYGFNIMWSKTFLYVFEPYIGYGQIKSTTDIEVSAATTVQIFTFNSNSSYSSKNSGEYITAGLNLNLIILKFGFEYDKIMGVKRYMGKFSLYF